MGNFLQKIAALIVTVSCFCGQAATTSIIVLSDPSSVELRPVNLIAAVNSSNRTAAQTSLWNTLGQPIRAYPLIQRSPTQYEAGLFNAATNKSYHPMARIFGYVILEFPTPLQDGQAGSSDGTTFASSKQVALATLPGILNAEIDEPGTFAALPIEQAGYLGNGAIPYSPTTTQWGMYAMRFDKTWSKIVGRASVGMVDTGIEITHPDLLANFRPRYSRGLDANRTPAEQITAFGFIGHGSHTAGIVGATHNNSTSSIVGGCQSCNLHIFRISETGPAQTALASTSSYESGAQVANFSFESTRRLKTSCSTNTDFSFRCTSFANGIARGAAYVASAGNNRNQDNLQNTHSDLWASPGNIPGVIAVSGLQYGGLNTAENANKWDFWTGAFKEPGGYGSNWGEIVNGTPEVSLIAPAKDVLSTFYTGADWSPDGPCGDSYGPPNSPGYGICTGTSMSAPHVSAAAGMVKSANPLLTGEEVKAILTSTAAPISGEGMNRQGYGLARVDDAVQKALDQGGNGKANAVNRVTPLFSFFSTIGQFTFGTNALRAMNHFYTTNPQMAIAASVGTLKPSPNPLIETNPPSWTYTCPSCTSSGTYLTIPGPFTIRVKNLADPTGWDDVLWRPIVGLTSPFRPIVITATQPGSADKIGALTDDPESTGDLKTTIASYLGTNPWTVTASIANDDMPVHFAPIGKPISNYSHFAKSSSNPNVWAGDGSLANQFPALAVAGLMTTHQSPVASIDDSKIIPLYRLTWRCGDPGRAMPPACDPNSTKRLSLHVARVYATSDTLALRQAQGYQLDGIEGYLFDSSLTTAPAGTAKLCQRYNSTTDDHALFLATDTANGCADTTPPFGNNGNPDFSLYNSNAGGVNGFLGYAYTDHTHRPLFKTTSSFPVNAAGYIGNGSFESPLLFAGTKNREPESVSFWTFMGEAGMDYNSHSLAAAEGNNTAWVRNAGRIKTITRKLLPGNYTLSFKHAKPAANATQSLKVSFADTLLGTVTSSSSSFSTQTYTFTVTEPGEYPIVFEGLRRQLYHTDVNPNAVSLIDAVQLLPTMAPSATCNLDIDGDGSVKATTDALALIRALKNMATADTGNAIRSYGATVTAANINNAVLSKLQWFDIDGDGKVDPDTDGVLLSRALMGFSGTAVTLNAVGVGASRPDWASIRQYLLGCGVTGLAP
jgi:Subtilase family